MSHFPPLSSVVEVALGFLHTCARKSDGTVLCWGMNAYGQLGDGTRVERSMPTPLPLLSSVAEIALGGLHSCARRTDNTIACWGFNAVGQLGDGTILDRPVPTPVQW
jgi:alpha-tubulin suppressor-like RCC1 family protein